MRSNQTFSFLEITMQRYYETNILLHRTLVFKETGACLKIGIPNAINRNAKCH